MTHIQLANSTYKGRAGEHKRVMPKDTETSASARLDAATRLLRAGSVLLEVLLRLAHILGL